MVFRPTAGGTATAGGVRAEVCGGGDNSCLVHIGGALSRQRTGVQTLHLAEILASTEAGEAS